MSFLVIFFCFVALSPHVHIPSCPVKIPLFVRSSSTALRMSLLPFDFTSLHSTHHAKKKEEEEEEKDSDRSESKYR